MNRQNKVSCYSVSEYFCGLPVYPEFFSAQKEVVYPLGPNVVSLFLGKCSVQDKVDSMMFSPFSAEFKVSMLPYWRISLMSV